MERKMAELKKASHCWWFDSHCSGRRSPWLQSTLSELEKKTKGMLNLIEGDADSFAQRAEIYYRKRPELVNMIENLYRSYRCLAEQHELLRAEVGSRRSPLFKCDSSVQSCSQKTWDSTDTSDYPESEVSEVDNLEQEEAIEIHSMFAAANEENEGIRRNLEAKSSAISLSFNSSVEAESEVLDDLQIEHQDVNKLTMELSLGKENDQKTVKPVTDNLMVNALNMGSLKRSSLDFLYSKESDNYSLHVYKETIPQLEMEDHKADDHGTKILHEKNAGDVLNLGSEVDVLKMEKGILMAGLARKDEEKRNVIRQLSLTVDFLKEENVRLKKFIKDSSRPHSVFEFRKLKDAFSRTGRLFGLSSQFHPALIAL